MKVICKLPNASESISGVAFKKHGEVMLSEDIGADEAANFAAIPGYEILPDDRDDERGNTHVMTDEEAAAAATDAAKMTADKAAADKKTANDKTAEKPATAVAKKK